jgi:hypothetical protein
MKLLNLSPLFGTIVAALLSVVVTAVLFICAQILFSGQRETVTKTFTQQMALRIGTMHALVVALVFSTLTGDLIKLRDLSDIEAISAANIYYTLKGEPSEEADKLQMLVPEYLTTVVEEDWERLTNTPHELPAWKILEKMQDISLRLPDETTSEAMIKKYIFDNLNEMANNRNKRLIERKAPDIPNVFWTIAIMGYFLTLLPYLTIELTRLRLFLVTCYAVIIGILFYGIAVLDHPFESGINKPIAFQIMYNDIKKSPSMNHLKSLEGTSSAN